MKNLAKHLPHYFGLIGVLVLGVLAFYLFSYDRSFQAAVVVAVAVSYVVWGVMHHHIHRDLHLAVFIEYLAVASLGLVIVFSLIFRT